MHSLLGGVPDADYLSIRASWCVQWLDRCLWISQSVAFMELDAFQEEDEDVSGGPELISSILVRGHLWNSFFLFASCCMVTWDLQLCEKQPLFHYEVFGTNRLWSPTVVFYPSCVTFQPSTVVLTLEIYYIICSLQYTLTYHTLSRAFCFPIYVFFLLSVMGLKDPLDAMYTSL